MVTLAGLIIARSEVEVNGKVWGLFPWSQARGQRPMSRLPFPGEMEAAVAGLILDFYSDP